MTDKKKGLTAMPPAGRGERGSPHAARTSGSDSGKPPGSTQSPKGDLSPNPSDLTTNLTDEEIFNKRNKIDFKFILGVADERFLLEICRWAYEKGREDGIIDFITKLNDTDICDDCQKEIDQLERIRREGKL